MDRYEITQKFFNGDGCVYDFIERKAPALAAARKLSVEENIKEVIVFDRLAHYGNTELWKIKNGEIIESTVRKP